MMKAMLILPAFLAVVPSAYGQKIDVCRDPVDNEIYIDKVINYQDCMAHSVTRSDPKNTDVKGLVSGAELACTIQFEEAERFAHSCSGPTVAKLATQAIRDGTVRAMAEWIFKRRRGD